MPLKKRFCEKCGAEIVRSKNNRKRGWNVPRFCPGCLKEIQGINGKRNLPAAELDPATCSKRRMKQIQHEESEANKLRDEGFEVLSPTVVCDRIAVKAGRVFFVEFKRPGQKLRPGQKRIQELVPEAYIVRVSCS
jgi:hypothetical protein